MGQIRKALSVGLIVAGTVLVFLGLYVGVGRGRATTSRRTPSSPKGCPRPQSGSCSQRGFSRPYQTSDRSLKLPRILRLLEEVSCGVATAGPKPAGAPRDERADCHKSFI